MTKRETVEKSEWEKVRGLFFRGHGIILLLVLSLNACVPVFFIHRTAIVGRGGSGKISDLKILKNRGVTRDAVQKQLGFIDTGSSTPSFFWGRWIRNWDMYWILLVQAGGGVEQLWGTQNVIVEFGQDGFVSHWDIVDDPKLLGKLTPVLKRNGVINIPTGQVPQRCCCVNQAALTEVRVKPTQFGSSGQDWIRLQFKGVRQNKNSVCHQEMSPQEAFAIISYLLSTGRESVFR